jgi:hypothetical protein
MLSTLFGSFADSFFSDIGASPIWIRYRGTVIVPTPIISHEGVQAAAEASRMMQNENFSTYTVSIPLSVLEINLGGQSTKATSPNEPWELSSDGDTWAQYRTLGDPEFEVFRVKLMLVAAK